MYNFRRSWDRAWSGARLQGTGDQLFGSLLAAYREPQRKYHTLQHLGECLALFDATRHLAERPSEVEFGLWFHDAIYEVKRSDNEQRSAEWAKRALLESGAEPSPAGRVESLVLVTKHTSVPAGLDEQLLADIDLSILAAGPERFAEYEKQIRDEYSFVPTWLFRSKRRSILKSFLARERIYGTEHFRCELEARARKNLERATAKRAA